MERDGACLPDVLVPYCRHLYERFQEEIEEDAQKRHAIIWVAKLLQMKDVHALEYLQEREYRVGVPSTAEDRVVKSTGANTVSAPRKSLKVHPLPPKPPPLDIKGFENRSIAGVPALTQTSAPPSSPTAGEKKISKKRRLGTEHSTQSGQGLLPLLKAPGQLQDSSTGPGVARLATSATVKQAVNATSTYHMPCVGDWLCKHCRCWNKLYQEKCRTTDHDTGRDCEGTRSFPDDVECVQEDNGRAWYNRMGRFKGDWYCGLCELWNFNNSNQCRACTTRSSEAEYTMGYEDNLKDAPPPPPSPERRTEAEKRAAFFGVNGRFFTPRKKKW